MSILTKVLKQTCVYWAPGDLDAYGKATFSDPVQLSCRWEKLVKEIISPDGTQTRPEIHVMLGEDVLEGGILMFGTLEDVIEDVPPIQNKEAFEIYQFKKIPNIRATKFFRQAILYRKTT